MAKRMAIFASGRGSNAMALQEACQVGQIDAKVVVLVSDDKNAEVLKKAQSWGVPTIVAERKSFASKDDFEAYLLAQLEVYQVDFIALAGYMRLLSATFISRYERRIVNIHPALLPSFTGLHAQRQAVAAGVKVAGCTVHFVDAGMDTGPIISQTAVPVYDEDTEDTLSARILTVEHSTYCRAVALYCADKLTFSGRLVVGAHKKTI